MRTRCGVAGRWARCARRAVSKDSRVREGKGLEKARLETCKRGM